MCDNGGACVFFFLGARVFQTTMFFLPPFTNGEKRGSINSTKTYRSSVSVFKDITNVGHKHTHTHTPATFI